MVERSRLWQRKAIVPSQCEKSVSVDDEPDGDAAANTYCRVCEATQAEERTQQALQLDRLRRRSRGYPIWHLDKLGKWDFVSAPREAAAKFMLVANAPYSPMP